MREPTHDLRRIRICLAIFMAGLVFSGITAFPLVHEVALLLTIANRLFPGSAAYFWIERVNHALADTAAHYPFLAYGTDWLAFAHLVFAVAFLGPWRDPVRNRWVIEFGVIACAGIIPLALIAGHARGIPAWWSVGDCCFGIFGAIPLLIALKAVRRLEVTR